MNTSHMKASLIFTLAISLVQLAYAAHSQTPKELQQLLLHKAEAIAPGSYRWKVTRVTQGSKEAAAQVVEQHKANKDLSATAKELEETYKHFAEPQTEVFEYELDLLSVNKWRAIQRSGEGAPMALTFYHPGDGKFYTALDEGKHVEITDASPSSTYTLIAGLPELFMRGWAPDLENISVRRDGAKLIATEPDEDGAPRLVVTMDAKTFVIESLVMMAEGQPRERVVRNGDRVISEVLDHTPEGKEVAQTRTQWDFLGFNKPEKMNVDFKLAPGCTVSINTATTHLFNVKSDDILLKKSSYDLP